MFIEVHIHITVQYNGKCLVCIRLCIVYIEVLQLALYVFETSAGFQLHMDMWS